MDSTAPLTLGGTLRQLHGLLVGDGAGDRRGVARPGGDSVDGLYAWLGHRAPGGVLDELPAE